MLHKIGVRSHETARRSECENGICTYHVPGTNKPTPIVETPATFPTLFLENMLGDFGRLSCLELATEPSPHSADGSSATAIPPGGFSAAGLGKAPLDGPLTRVPREQRQLLVLRSHFPPVPLSPSVIELLSQPVLSHAPAVVV